MSLFITSSKNKFISGGSMAKGYRLNWNLNRFGGGYGSGKNFFYIHWEIYSGSPNIVRFHIESPKLNTDETLNNLKFEIAQKIISNFDKIREQNKSGILKTSNINEDKIRNDKLTELFQIILPEETSFAEFNNSLKTVDKEIGNFIDSIIKPYEQTLKRSPYNLRHKEEVYSG